MSAEERPSGPNAMPGARKAAEKLQGIGASPGIAIGRAYLLDRKRVTTPHYTLPEGELETELMRFRTAVMLSDHQLGEVKERLEKSEGGKEHALIVEAHRMMLNDPMLVDTANGFIRDENVNAEWAVRRTVEHISTMFSKIGDEYLRERAADVEFVGDRLQRNLLGLIVDALDAPELPEDSIVIAHDLPPSDAALLLQTGRCLGFITDVGGQTSHTAIVARAREIPGVVGAAPASERIAHGERVALDGGTGVVILRPTPEQERLFEEARRRKQERELENAALRELSATTLDDRTLQLVANLEFVEEVPTALGHGAQGVGLFRTEFLYLGRNTAPTEEEHYAAYRAVLERMEGRPVTIRTMDLGGDKISAFDQKRRTEKEANPALGLRALRFCLANRDVFRTQLRAMLRASIHGPMRIMFPMVSGIGELREAKSVLAATRIELAREGVPVAEEIPVGIMVETPSAALVADRLARECDFFSVGTNDLIQYSVAIDRQNRGVAYLYRPLQLSILRSLKQIAEGARSGGIPVAMCGEMAGDPLNTLVLIGLGFDSLSMSAGQIPAVKRIVRAASKAEAERLVAECLALDTADEIERHVKGHMERRFAG